MATNDWSKAQAKSLRQFFPVMVIGTAFIIAMGRWLAPEAVDWLLSGAVAAWFLYALSMAGARLWEKAALGAWILLFPIWGAAIFANVEAAFLGDLSFEERLYADGVKIALVGAIGTALSGALTAAVIFVVTRAVRPPVWCFVAALLAAIVMYGVRGAESFLMELLGSRAYWSLQNFVNFVGPLLWFALTLWGLLTWARPRALRRVGLCEKCGYDTAGAPGEKCPECGVAATSQH